MGVSVWQGAPMAISEDAVIEDWVTREFGGSLLKISRQSRWRPVWQAEVERDGEILPIMVRGERTDTPLIFPLRHEMILQEQLWKAGIPIPEVYGWLDELPAYAMQRVGGRPDFADSTTEERDQVMYEYMGILARMHRLDVEPFAAAGITRADRPSEAAAKGVEQFVQTYRATKKRPDPFLEFALGWLRRNPLPPRDAEAPIVWDSGQFHHENGRVTAVIDVEIGYIGDPMMDLAAFRMRDTVLHFGDFNTLYRWYEEQGGFPLDLDVIQWHHIFFTLSNELSFHTALADPTPDSDYMTNLQWCSETNLHAVEALAERLGYDLEPVDVPGAPDPSAAIGHQHLVRTLRSLDPGDEYLQYRLRAAFRLSRHLQRVDEIGAEITAADLDDLHELLGHRPRTQAEGDAALEEYVLQDEGRHDEGLVQLFNRRFTRLKATLGPAGSAMVTHHKVAPFTH
jgi:hypothetical protein